MIGNKSRDCVDKLFRLKPAQVFSEKEASETLTDEIIFMCAVHDFPYRLIVSGILSRINTSVGILRNCY